MRLRELRSPESTMDFAILLNRFFEFQMPPSRNPLFIMHDMLAMQCDDFTRPPLMGAETVIKIDVFINIGVLI